MSCRFCGWLCDRFCPPESRDYWSIASRWEEHYAFEWEPWDEDEARRARADEAAMLVNARPQAALRALSELADEGSVYAMRWVAVVYRGGYGIARDPAVAEDYFLRAANAGSWMATIGYAKLLYARGAREGWTHCLSDGLRNGFVPAMFWLAWYRYRDNPTWKTAREVRSLLDDAAGAGHPGAKLILARWTGTGKFGLRHIPRGFAMMHSVIADMRDGGAQASA